MKVRLDRVRANPFRDIGRYPIDREKIEALKASIASTGFWENVVARPSPTVEGDVELAYGHHRLVALREQLGDKATVELIVKPLGDSPMLRIMADENMQEWTHTAAIEQETISAVVKAYGDGKIELAEPNGSRGPTRHAPSFRLETGRSDGKFPYTAETIASFLHWPVGKVERALGALAAIEAQDVPQEVFEGLGATLGQRVVHASHAAQARARGAGLDEDRAKEIGREVASQMADEFRDGGVAIGTKLTERREQMIDERVPRSATPKLPAKVAQELYDAIREFWSREVYVSGSGTLTREELIRTIAANRDAVDLRTYGTLTAPWSELIAEALGEMAVTASAFADVLQTEKALVEA